MEMPMRLEQVSLEAADGIVARLKEKRVLEGTFDLQLRPGFTDRYQIISPVGRPGTYSGVTGIDLHRGRITLLRSHSDAVLLLDATAKPIA
jgi:hypothetical protein